MENKNKTKKQLVDELNQLRQRVKKLEVLETEYMRVEKVLRESEEKYRLVLENAYEGIVVDQDGTIKFISPKATDVIEYSGEELISKPFIELIHPDDRETLMQRHVKMLNGEEITNPHIFRVFDKKGEMKWVKINSVLITWKDKPASLNFLGNITEYEQTEEALLVSEKRRRMSTYAGQVGIWDWNLETNEIYVDPNLKAMLGYSDDEIKNHIDDWGKHVHPEDAEDVMAEARAHLEGKKTIYEVEHRMLHKDGSIRWFLARGTAVQDEKGKPYRMVGTDTDITEKKQAEEAIKESEEKWRNLFENSIEAAFTVDIRGNFTSINKAGAILLGMEQEKLIGVNYRQYIKPEIAKEVFKAYNHLFRTGEPIRDLLYKTIRENGEERIVEGYANTIRKGDKIIGFQGTLRDITDRKRTEEALRESERKIRDIFETSRDVIYISSAEGKFININSAAEELFGYTMDELLNLDVRDIYKDPEDRKKFQKEIEEKGSVKDYEITFKKKDGTPIECLLTSTLRRDENGNVLGYQGIIDDITEKKRMENLVRESEEKFRSLFEHAADSIVLFDAETGEMDEFNNKAYENLGYTREEFKKLKIPDYEVIQSAEDVSGHINKIINEGEDIFETKQRRKNGEVRDILVSARNISIRGRNFIQGIWRDITERKRMEEQLLRSQKMEAIATLTGGIAHDFNNIMTSILGYASLLKEKSKKGDPYYDYLKSIENSALRASDLTSQLLAYTRKGKLEVKPIDVNRVVNEVHDLISKTFDKSIKIILKSASDLMIVEGDESQLNQVVMNIAINAQDSMPNGGTLKIKTCMEKVKEKIIKQHFEVEEGEYVCMKFTDNGIGMDENTLKRIFEPYYTTKEDRGGTGLGMSVVYGIIKGHDGYIDIESDLGKGTEITIYLPASKKDEDVFEKEVEEVEGGSETVLVVDDEKAILSMLKDTLEGLDYKVYTRDSGITGLKTFMEKDIDLVILDIKMPDMGGKEVLEKMLEIDPKVKILLFSGYSEQDKHKDLLGMGAKGFIGKPFKIDEFLRKVREVLDQ